MYLQLYSPFSSSHGGSPQGLLPPGGSGQEVQRFLSPAQKPHVQPLSLYVTVTVLPHTVVCGFYETPGNT